MITIYKANNSIDANLIQGILANEGINCHIMGGYLEGGVGELLPHGLVTIMADESDATKARKIIDDWENKEIELTVNEN